MADSRDNTPKGGAKDQREARLKAALKANIARRKAQARARKMTAHEPSGHAPSGENRETGRATGKAED